MTDRIVETERDRTMFFSVPGFEEFYEFNLAGEARTKPRYVNSPICGGRRLIPSHHIRVRSVKGYPAFLVCVGGKRTTVYLHRVIAKKFVPNPDGKPHVNHIDGDKANFSVSNLEWCTHRENMRHAFSAGLARFPTIGPGEASPSAKLNDEKVREIKRLLQRGQPQKSLAARYGVSCGTIGFIARRETWGHIEP